ncbi:hypothetical protein [Opitutus terrae]|uniref:Cytochrome oxidase subunit I profile domain-containing protein n=1 Tax=Opitutus terrae (strain DSM 11246 / JCM 15787 / PB90-1) TaxID=452637 RepID=B1ZSK6_OPITP|nr:hypothetical protein [Opitutus terrae]ACB73863.1 hypothetical protein Oter_0573 [Opitutus terrae PB90-1]
MSPIAPVAARPFGRTVALYSLGWLVAANLVGLWLAVSLLWPEVGNVLAPLTFGRWTPLHMNWQLYGWCALPTVGALLALFFDPQHPRARRHAQLALAAWSAALALGGLSWLAGVSSGKLFLDWHGWARPLLPLAMIFLWGLLAAHTRRRWPELPRSARLLRVVVLLALAVVPGVIFWSAGRNVYHPINPDSGGATGAAVLGSTLGIVTICFALPAFLGLPRTRPVRRIIGALLASWLVFAVIDHGNISHHVPAQIIALATLLAWIPLLPMFWWRHHWPSAARPWLLAAVAWWAVLVATGWISFLPHVSEALKFTHALVGHAHLAMAGFLTNLNGILLVVLTGRRAPRSTFWLWQAGCAIYVLAMWVLGYGEIGHLAELFRSEPWTQGLLGTRLAAGLAMTTASVLWLMQLARAREASATAAAPAQDT